ncbi:MAG: outer membrane protein [Candidatus Acidiferrales bacterium]
MAAARGLLISASVGYAYLSLDMPSSGRVNLSGINAAVTADILPRIGVTADFTYARAANLFDTGHHVDLLSYLGGPVFYPTRARRLTTFVHALIGGARVTGVVPSSGNTYLTGYTNRLSWALGGGAEYQASPSIAFQVSGDYLRTGYFNSNAAIRGQSNLRIVCGMVYSFWKHPERRR